MSGMQVSEHVAQALDVFVGEDGTANIKVLRGVYRPVDYARVTADDDKFDLRIEEPVEQLVKLRKWFHVLGFVHTGV